ncbi:hypothetical protein AVJ23_17035 [Pseudoponticoccus marisrubri]|uniref:NAD-dependent epimerase/dehydratase domain-containing protein n=2 Tax=Pseudoponticoccus marisrubri TaxID=1685382 RepID=A0A0W7WG29_9RHOB|nr:hypothetical protein AVJ23_17035 [Pseudoponticoccus marisrubri]
MLAAQRGTARIGYEIVPVARRAGDEVLQWAPGDPMTALPPARAVIAAWGVTEGTSEELAANVELARCAMEVGAATGADMVLHMSSAAVYRPQDAPLSEDVPADPPAPYGGAKLEMEQAVIDWAARHPDGPRPILLRIGNVAGADSLFRNLKPGGTLRLDRFPDGAGPNRSYATAADILRVCGALIAAGQGPHVLNVCAPRPTPMEEIARAADCEVTWQDAPETANRTVWLDTTRLSRLCTLPDEASDAEYVVQAARDSGLWP